MLNRRFETSQPHTLGLCEAEEKVSFIFFLLVSVDQFSDGFLNLNSFVASFPVDRFRILPGFSSSSDPISHVVDLTLSQNLRRNIPLTFQSFTVKSVAIAVIDVFSR